MADKSHKTRQKLVFRGPVKPRNPIAVPARLRRAGSHTKTASTERQAGKLALKKALDPPEE